jgi:hypothetical protein
MALAYEAEKYAKYNYWSSFSGTDDIPENYANISCQVKINGEITTLILTQDGFKNQEAIIHSKINWTAMMDEMKKLIE